jgi:hypothetical protein
LLRGWEGLPQGVIEGLLTQFSFWVRKDFVPGLPPDAKHLITQQDALREVDSTDPDITHLNTDILAAILAGKHARWKEKIESCNFRNNPGKYWSLLKSLLGKSARPPPNQPISFKGKVQFKDKDIALKFCKQYTTVTPQKSSKDTRRVLRQMRASHKLDNNFSPFTVKNVEAAISHSKNSSAVDLDGLTAVHLKHLGPWCLKFLTELFNLSIRHANIPVIWKEATIVPILKPGKSAELGSSYRPISLLSPAVKILERLLKPDVNIYLPKNSNQHAYAEMHSTVTA